MIDTNGRYVRHADGDCRLNTGVTGNDTVRSIDQNWVYESELFNASRDLLDLARSVGARIARSRLQIPRIYVFDGQGDHDQSPWLAA